MKCFGLERADLNRSPGGSRGRKEEMPQFAASISRTPPGMLAVNLLSSLLLPHSDSLTRVGVILML